MGYDLTFIPNQTTCDILLFEEDNLINILRLNYSIDFLSSLEEGLTTEEIINQNLLYFENEIYNFLIKNKMKLEMFSSTILSIIHQIDDIIRPILTV